MGEDYIRQVKKKLAVSGREKREILRDLEEIFRSAAEEGETEEAVKRRLGPPEAYVRELEEALGEKRGRGSLYGAIFLAALAVLLTGIFLWAKALQKPEDVIGWADGMTGLQVTGPSYLPLLFPAAAALFLAAAIFLAVRYVKRRKR